MDTIRQLFNLLDRWRHLPKYQLERRADIFFALYLPAFLGHRLKRPLKPLLIPEFPICHATIGLNHNNQSCNADYLALAEDSSAAFLVELKTEGNSRNNDQDVYLQRARTVGLVALLEGVVQIAMASKAKRKYCQLLKELEKLGLVTLPANLDQRLAGGRLQRLSKDLASVRVIAANAPIQIVYLQPRAAAEGEIGFDELANWLRRFDDPISKRFGESLIEWHNRPSGECAADD